jgi:hypothetical protein
MPAILEKWHVQPHEQLIEIDDGILTVAGEITMPLGNFPRRMTVVRLTGDRTAIWSAMALDEAEMATIEAMGRPSFLIVPNDFHRMDAKIWKDRYPEIKVVTPPGARARVAEIVPVDATSDILGDPAVQFIVVPGTEEHEAALVIRRPGGVTIAVNDVIGNVAHPHGIGAHILARLMGFGVSRPRVPRPVKFRMIKDRPALAAQFRDWADMDALRRIIVSHGDPIENPRDVLHSLAGELT